MRKIRKLFLNIIFWGIFIFLFAKIQSVFLPNWSKETIKYSEFYNLEDDVIDILFLGHSHNYCSIYPMELYADYGIRSYNLGSPSQNMQQSYYQLIEAYKTQKVKYCFLEVSSLFLKTVPFDGDNQQRYKMMVSLPFSINKMNLISSCTHDWKSILEIMIPLYKFHERWSELTQNDFANVDNEEYVIAYGGYFDTDCNPYLGYSNQYSPSEIIMTEEYEDLFSAEEEGEKRVLATDLDAEACAYFEKVCDYCCANGITLVPIIVSSISCWGDARHQVAENYLEQHDLSLVDTMYAPNEVDIDWNRDTSDGGTHLNFQGGLKITNYLGNYIMENCDDLRINTDFSTKTQWDSDVAKYKKLKLELLLSMRTDMQKTQDLFEKMEGDMSNSLLLLSVRDDMSTFWNDELDTCMGCIGLNDNFYDHKQESYIAVIDRGKITFEQFSLNSLIYKGTFSDDSTHSLYIKSENIHQGDSSQIIIDAKEYSLDLRGLNIVIYDYTQKKVVKQVAIGLTVTPLIYYENEPE